MLVLLNLLKKLQQCQKQEKQNSNIRQDYLDDIKEFDLMVEVFNPLIKNYHRSCGDVNNTKVVNYMQPTQLLEQLNLSFPDEGETVQEIGKSLEQIFDYSVRTSNPRFLDKLYTGVDPMNIYSEMLVGLLNTNIHTYASSQVLTLIEVNCIKELGKLAGYTEGMVDGIFVPGGSYANMIALMVARHEKFPHVRNQGWKAGDNPVVLTSAQSHYSVSRAAMMAGIGMENCISVKCSLNGCMDIEDLKVKLEKCFSENKTPFFMGTTAGTTVMGGFDPFEEIAVICKQHNIWFHIDGCWGGHCLYSSKYEKLYKGINLSDSLALDQHKGLGVTIFSAVILTNNKPQALQKSNTSGAEYLFHQNGSGRYDLGDKSLQCGRRNDALKFWLHSKKQGRQGLKNRVEAAYNKSQDIAKLILAKESTGGFKLVVFPLWCNICFWYIPKAFRKNSIEQNYQYLSRITQIIYDRMQKAGTMLVNHNPLKDHNLPNFFRMIVNQPRTKFQDLIFVLEEIERLGADITVEDL